jgi:hypothetical protein
MSKALDFLGVISPSSAIVGRAGSADAPMAYIVGPAVVGGISGFALWKKHPVLGFFSGEAIGANAYRVYRGQGDDRTIAACGLGTQACAVTGSLMNPKHPFYGYVGGFILGSVVSAFIPGSNVHRFVRGK